jgi:hypothetical protein
MSRRVYKSSDIITSAIRKAMLPDTQSTFRDEDFLAFANEEMDMGIVPFIMSFREDYYMNTVDIPLVEGQTRYSIPYRSVGNKLREVQWSDPSGNLVSLSRIFIEDLPRFQFYSQTWSLSSGSQYYLENDEIVLTSPPAGGNQGKLRVSFYIRPNALVDEKRVMFVTSVNKTTGEIVVDKIPTGLYTSGTLVDMIEHKSPNKILSYDVPLTLVNILSKTITIDPALIPAGLTVGDQISLAEETAIAQIPTELQSLLSQRVAARCLEALGDAQGLQAANAKIAEIEQKASTLLDGRVEGSPLKILPPVGTMKSIGAFRRNYWRR